MDSACLTERKIVLIGLSKNSALKKMNFGDFPGGAGDENPPANAGDTGLTPGPERFRIPRSNQAHVPQLLSLHGPEPVLCNKRAHRSEKPVHCT